MPLHRFTSPAFLPLRPRPYLMPGSRGGRFLRCARATRWIHNEGERMGKINSAHAWANNEVAYVAWDIDGKIDGCLGFDVTRVYLNEDGSVALLGDGTEDRVKCAT